AQALALRVEAEGRQLFAASLRVHAAICESKSEDDFSTVADRATERRLQRALREIDPSAGFLGEESAERFQPQEWNWVVDPIDGTSNFEAGVGVFGIAAAWVDRKGSVHAAACFDGRTQQCYFAAAGQGAWRLAAPRPIRWRCIKSAASPTGPRALVGVQWDRRRRPTLLSRVSDYP
ncbi:MAG: hypothetical protein JNL98_44450, partial [Bryobacterales bacterium]|nr:hypothetical protein [Bryobacterales bacterium]